MKRISCSAMMADASQIPLGAMVKSTVPIVLTKLAVLLVYFLLFFYVLFFFNNLLRTIRVCSVKIPTFCNFITVTIFKNNLLGTI